MIFIEIPNVVITPSFVAYRIELSSSLRTFAVLKRYKTIRAFDKRLRNTFQNLVGSSRVKLPTFPPKRIFGFVHHFFMLHCCRSTHVCQATSIVTVKSLSCGIVLAPTSFLKLDVMRWKCIFKSW